MKRYSQNFNVFKRFFRFFAFLHVFMKQSVSYGRALSSRATNAPAPGGGSRDRYLLNFAPCTIHDSSPYARKT